MDVPSITRIPPCTTCGQPSMTWCIDLIEPRLPLSDVDDLKRYEQLGGPRYGCDDHPVKTERYRA